MLIILENYTNNMKKTTFLIVGRHAVVEALNVQDETSTLLKSPNVGCLPI